MRGSFPLAFLLFAYLQSALACDPKPEWRQATPQSAFTAARVVVHARVASVQGSDPWFAIVDVLQTLKGSFSGNTVRTASHSLCGIGKFEVGREYVFFFQSSDSWFVTHLVQPMGFTTEQTLKALSLVRS